VFMRGNLCNCRISPAKPNKLTRAILPNAGANLFNCHYASDK
jgi:hypothetical protein